jgi:hypothetical protein
MYVCMYDVCMSMYVCMYVCICMYVCMMYVCIARVITASPAALALKRKTGTATTPLTPRSWGRLGALRGRGWCVHAM